MMTCKELAQQVKDNIKRQVSKAAAEHVGGILSGKDVAVSDKYELIDISDRPDKYVCSLGRDAVLNEGWKPTNITLGDKLHSAFSQIGEAFKGGM